MVDAVVPRKSLIGLALAAVIAVVYGPALTNGFLSIDDPIYVLDNEVVRRGLSAHGIRWAFTTFDAANWHPLAWLSHMWDVDLFGLNPAGHHLTSILLHALNTVLAFLVLSSLTGSTWRSAIVAALFGIHPLHVESVAWVSERKDVLATFWGFLAMLTYGAYARRPGLGRYAAVAALFGLSLLSKPMLVTLPFLFLLLDAWPLRRFAARTSAGSAILVLEKVPLLLLSLASAAITLVAQHRGGMVKALVQYPLDVRLGNALWSYASYLGKTVYPAGLAAVYGHPGTAIPAWRGLGVAGVLLGLTVAFGRQARSRPYLAVGWLWYLITLVPAIGIVQVADQAMADRYTYLPLLGVFIMATWGFADLTRALRVPVQLRGLAAMVVIVVLSTLTSGQVRLWRDDLTLFRHAARVHPDDYLGRLNHGLALARAGKLPEAEAELGATLRLKPDLALAHQNLGLVLANSGRMPEAARHFTAAVQLHPGYAEAHANLGMALLLMGDVAEAEPEFREALSLDPDQPIALTGLADIERRRARGQSSP